MTPNERPGASPFHEGELAVQRQLGVKDKVARFGDRAILPFMPDEHREFFESLPFVFVASLDATGCPWASMVWGIPGFASSPRPDVLYVAGKIVEGDPLAQNLAVGAPVGVLGLDLETRRRNRANGAVTARDGDAFAVRVTQSFGNCQKYIQIREAKFRRDPFAPHEVKPVAEGALLSAEAEAMVDASDTFFIASRSAHPSDPTRGDGVDVSHRGGLPSVASLTVEGERHVITFPDYLGNFLFNTLGNIAVEPRVGLLFVDFEKGNVLTLTGDAHIVWDGPEVHAVRGAQRLVRVELHSGFRMDDALPFTFSKPEFAPQFARM